MDPITVTVEHDGQTLEVPHTAIALPEGAGFYGADFGDPSNYTANERFESEVQRRADSKVKKGGYLTKEDAYKPDALKQFYAAKGIELDEDGLPVAKHDPDKLKAFRSAWEEEAVTPLKAQIADMEAKYAAVRESQLAGQILAAATAAGVKAERLKPVFEGQAPEILQVVRPVLKASDEGEGFFYEKGGFPVAVSDQDGFAGLGKLFADLRKGRPDLFDDTRNGSSGFTDNGRGGGRTMTRADFDALPPLKQAEAAKKMSAGELAITD